MAVIVTAAFLCTMDRLVLNLLVDQIRGDLRISETQFSLLQGASFTIINSLAALPLGLAADKWSRRTLLIGGVLIWSAATLAGGFAVHFETFFIARMFVGLGEAALWPVAVSVIADVLPPARRGRAIGLVLLGQILGSGASLIMVGVVVRLAMRHAFDFLPVIGVLPPWRVVLMLWGLLGLPVILMLLAAPEPKRRGSEHGALDLNGLGWFFRFMAGKWRSMLPMCLGAAFISTGSYALAAWAPAFFIRRFALSPASLGPVLGTIGIVGGIIGTTLAGFVADRQERAGRPAQKMTMLMLTALACAPVALLCLAPSPVIAYVIQGLSLILLPIAGTLTNITMQDLVPAGMRGKAMAIPILVGSLFGATLGPSFVALLTQHVFADPAKVGYSIALVIGPAMLAAAFCFWRVRAAWSGGGDPA